MRVWGRSARISLVDVEVGEPAGRAGTGVERGWSQDEGAESRPGFFWSNCYCFSVLSGDVWVEGGEASSAGHGQEVGKLGYVYMPWPQSGRMQYEETKTNKNSYLVFLQAVR
jgi:hypothetical protein